MMQLIYNTLRGYLPYARDRRNQAKRILGWAIAFSCWIPLVWVWLAVSGCHHAFMSREEVAIEKLKCSSRNMGFAFLYGTNGFAERYGRDGGEVIRVFCIDKDGSWYASEGFK